MIGAGSGTKRSGRIEASRIAEGAYGEVWLARNLMGTYRAVKIVNRTREAWEWRRELEGIKHYEPISRSHDGLIDILHVGKEEADRYFYYVMELADHQGEAMPENMEEYRPKTLRGEIKSHTRLPVDQCIEIGSSLARALSHLHSRGLVHRDIKPSNIIFVNGQPKLADIGLVTGENDSRSIVGTEGYIPPDGPGTRKADIFGLGILLYEASTGLKHFRAPSLPDDFDQWPEFEKTREFLCVVANASHPDPARRYNEAAAIVRDLLIVAEGQSLAQLQRLQRQLESIKRIAPMVGVVVIVLLIIGLLLAKNQRQARMMSEATVATLVTQGSERLESRDLLGALPFFVDALAEDQDEARGESHRIRIGAILSHAPELLRVWNAGDVAADLSYHTQSDLFMAAIWDKPRALGRIASGDTTPFPSSDGGWTDSCAFDRSGGKVVSTNGGEMIQLHSFPDGELLQTLTNAAFTLHVDFDPSGQKVIGASEDGKARIWNLFDGAVEMELVGHTAPLMYAEFSRSGSLAITASQDHTARVWRVATGEQIAELKHESWVYQARFSPDETRAITGSFDRTAREWRIPSGEQILPAYYHASAVAVASYSPDGKLALTGDWGGTVCLWESASRRAWTTPRLYVDGRILDAEFTPDSRELLLCSQDGLIQAWRLQPQEELMKPMEGWPSRSGRHFAEIAGGRLRIRSIEVPAGSARSIPAEGVVDAVFDETDQFVAVRRTQGSGGGRVEVWNLAAKERQSAVEIEPGAAQMWLGSSGSPLYVIQDGVLYVKHADEAVERSVIPSFDQMAIGPNGSYLAFGEKQTFTLWNVKAGRQAWPPLTADAEISSIHFSGDGKKVVFTCRDPQLYARAAHVLATANGRPAAPPLRHRDGVMTAAFAPGHTDLIVTGGEDALTLFWDGKTGDPIGEGIQHVYNVHALAISPNGRWVAFGEDHGSFQIWAVESRQPLTQKFALGADVKEIQWNSPNYLWARTEDGKWWLCELRPDARPVEELVRHSRLVAPRGITSVGGGVNEVMSLWESVREAGSP